MKGVCILRSLLISASLFVLISLPVQAGKKKKEAAADQQAMSAETLTGLTLRGIGPALCSGRIGAFAVNPAHKSEFYVAVSSGGVFKTVNAGTTWTPVFDEQGSYSIGTIAMDPHNPYVIWVGTGENNSQRSVGYGDGVYKSLDGGASWSNMGLKESEHIGKILIDPRDSDVVYVAAQGPLWRSGGDRGLYKTTDGGTTWTCVLEISPDTGISDVVFDPRDPDVLIASAYQRRRHVWTLINGGPESAIYKTTDAGKTWRKITSGLPKDDMGRIGLAIAPSNPDIVYAIIEAANEAGGVYRSTNRGETWEKRSDYVSSSPQYYQEIAVDPQDENVVYSLDTWLHRSMDGGTTFTPVGEAYKHVDNHAIWFDPNDPQYLLVGCDGGIYESFDRGATWRYMANLPVTQFYRVALDDDQPFYHIYGGTQDNYTLCTPSQTRTVHGITNREVFTVRGGDGFEPQIDPTDPNIIYAQAQYGALVRYDRQNGERIDIQPQPGEGEPPLRWNWNSPLIISPHDHQRLYFGANILFRSNDRGDTWQPISPDLTRQLDRNQLPVMGKIQSIDAVSKNASTSYYGNIVSLAESPLREGLLVVGTDDGLIQITQDGGATWSKIEAVNDVPEGAYVSCVAASKHQPEVVFAAFDNHKRGDFAPYLLRSNDLGASWQSITGNLPGKGTVYCFIQDFVEPDLLFVGTEFGLFFSSDGGTHWVQLKGGMPTIAVRDLAIQKREHDLVLATFGRGFFVLDDFSPLRTINPTLLEEKAVLFPVKTALMYIQSSPLGGEGPSFLGDGTYTAPNPPFGAVFTYYLKEDLLPLKKQRQERERELALGDQTVLIPSWDELRREAREEPPTVVFVVRDDQGEVVRRIEAPAKKGIHRVSWDLRYPPATPVSLTQEPRNKYQRPPQGPMAMPGRYTVSMATRIDGMETELGLEQEFRAEPLGISSLPQADRQALTAFQKETASLQRAVTGTARALAEITDRVAHLRQAIDDTPRAPAAWRERVRRLDHQLADMNIDLNGDPVKAAHNEPQPPSMTDRISRLVRGHWAATSQPTETQRAAYTVVSRNLADFLDRLRDLVEGDLAALEADLEAVEAPWTPGRLPTWQPR